jgi:hypothetical protein
MTTSPGIAQGLFAARARKPRPPGARCLFIQYLSTRTRLRGILVVPGTRSVFKELWDRGAKFRRFAANRVPKRLYRRDVT